jgi:c-di-AMP phosphodiesterase-like protein
MQDEDRQRIELKKQQYDVDIFKNKKIFYILLDKTKKWV